MLSKKVFMGIFAAFMLASCSNDEFVANEAANVQREKCTLRFKVKPFTVNDGIETRASIGGISNNKSFLVDFESGDLFGVCALDGSFNAPYPCSSIVDEDDAQTVILDAGQLHSMLWNKVCVAYYPYNHLHKPDDFNVLFPFNMQKQTLVNNGNYLVNNCNYYVSEPFCFDGYISPELEFQPVNSIFEVIVDLPPVNDKYRKIELVSTDGSKPFTEYVRYSISEEGIYEPIVLNEWKKNSTSLDISEMEITSGEQHFYIACFPTENFGKFVVEATTNNGVVYKSDELSLKNNKCKAGYGYKIKAQNMKKVTSKYGTENGYEYVDLGLSSGLKWAKMNLGAMSETDYGKYYAWGETKGYMEEDQTNLRNQIYNSKHFPDKPYIKHAYCPETYKWGNGDWNSVTNYCLNSEHGKVDNKATLSAFDDAAVQNWGGSWRMPTGAEQKELLDNCYCVWTDGYKGTDVSGYIIYKALNSSDKGKFVVSGKTPKKIYTLSVPHIFFPLPGYYYLDFWGPYISGRGSYLSSSLSAGEYNDDMSAKSIWLTSDECKMSSSSRYLGCTIRAVCK